MKKLTLSMLALGISLGLLKAAPVPVSTAQKVATNIYHYYYPDAGEVTLSLAYTQTGASGEADFYVFNVNSNNGFVIVSAEDATKPLIGYSSTGQFVLPNAGNNFDYWMKNKRDQIESVKLNKRKATAEITSEWQSYSATAAPVRDKKKFGSVAPLTTITWDQQYQPYPYNYFCPPKTTGSIKNNSVTGCVATAMSQIMRYWSYPAHGLNTFTYDENTAPYYDESENYGVLARNFANDNYNWSVMPTSPTSTSTVTTADTEIARVMFDAGVSVAMDYAPSGSGAFVLSQDDSVSAEGSYVRFFGFNRYTIKGYYDTTMGRGAWEKLIMAELSAGRLAEYAGDASDGGHTWLVEGWTSGTDTTFYMNWGWSGTDNGNFTVTNLDPAGQAAFTTNEEVLVGIEPAPAVAHFIASQPNVCAGGTVTFTDQSLAYPGTTVASWSWSFPGGTPSTSTSQNPTVTYNTPGIYSVTEIVTSSKGGDTLTRNAYVNVSAKTGAALPLSQGFESTTFPPTGWYLNNPNMLTTSTNQYGSIWQLNSGTNAGGFSKSNNCMIFNNYNYNPEGGQRQQIYTPGYNFGPITNGKLYFDVAYQPLSKQYTDTLVVYYSTNCGQTWTSIYSKGGLTLGTAGDTLGSSATNGFTPTSAQWRTDTISLPAALNGVADVMFSFENRSFNGGPIYIDNVNIPAAPLAVQTITTNNGSVSLYPNPSNGTYTVDLTNANITEGAHINVYDALGQMVYTSSLNDSKTNINMQGKATGIYIFKVVTTSGQFVSSGKLTIE